MDFVATAPFSKMPFVKNAAGNCGTSAVAGVEMIRTDDWAQKILRDP